MMMCGSRMKSNSRKTSTRVKLSFNVNQRGQIVLGVAVAIRPKYMLSFQRIF